MKLVSSVVLSLLLLFSSVHSANATDPTNVEYGIDRPGADYSNFNIGPDYNICKTACENDSRCQAFTYVHPGVQGPSARCWLKTVAAVPVRSGCCYSGVKQVTRENGWNRPGSDYQNFELAFNATAEDCAQYCRRDSRCLAYTYVQPNFQGPNPQCWLKSRVPAPAPDPRCSSGTVNWR